MSDHKEKEPHVVLLGATGKVGTPLVERLALRARVTAVVRDAAKAARLYAGASVDIVQSELTERGRLREIASGADVIVTTLGSIGIEAAIQRLVLEVAREADVPQVVRLSVLNTGADSFGINQRGHHSIDLAASFAGVGYTTVRPAIFSSNILLGAAELRARGTWTGLADTGRVGFIHPLDVADALSRVVLDPAEQGRHHDLTGPELLTWPDALAIASAEVGRELRFVTTSPEELLHRLVGAGVPPGQAELLIAREWAIQAGENERLTDDVLRLTGHTPRTMADFAREHRAELA